MYDHITISYEHVTLLCDNITIIYDQIITSCHEIKRSQRQMKPTHTKRPFKPLPGNRKPSEGKQLAPSLKSAHKISKTTCDTRKKTSPRER